MTPEEVIALFKTAFDALDQLTAKDDQAQVMEYIEDREEVIKYIP